MTAGRAAPIPVTAAVTRLGIKDHLGLTPLPAFRLATQRIDGKTFAIMESRRTPLVRRENKTVGDNTIRRRGRIGSIQEPS